MHVSQSRLDDVLEALEVQAETSRQEEEGCLRFEVFREEEDPGHIFIHEIYATKQDYEEVHRNTSYFARWRSAIEGALLEERVIFRQLPVRMEL